jgi:hypothetical protein
MLAGRRGVAETHGAGQGALGGWAQVWGRGGGE